MAAPKNKYLNRFTAITATVIFLYRKGRVVSREQPSPDGKLLGKQEFPYPPVQP